MAAPTLTYPEAIIIGLLQGVTELFPVSSLGHSVLIPAIIGGRWASDLSMTADQSPYLAFIVAVHVPIAGLSLFPLLMGWPVIFTPIHIAFLELVIDPVCSIVFESRRRNVLVSFRSLLCGWPLVSSLV